MQRALRKRKKMVTYSMQRMTQGRPLMPDKFGWHSTEQDGPPKHRGWYLTMDSLCGSVARERPWGTQFWSGEEGTSCSSPIFYHVSPGKEAYKAPPKPQPCPVCGSEPKLCRDYSYFIRCTKHENWGTCLIGPKANSEEHAISLWNTLRCERPNTFPLSGLCGEQSQP